MLISLKKDTMEETRKGGRMIFNKKDIADMFGYGRDKTKRLLESGILPVIKLNKDYIIYRDALEKWLKQNEGKEIRF